MNRRNLMMLLTFIMVLMKVKWTTSLEWDRVRCSSDPEQSISDGTVADTGRFPWLGIVQHSFYIGGTTRFAITVGLLVHPAYAIAPAEDIARILHEQLQNNTKFILWESSTTKYALDVNDYILHPEYDEKPTLATIALLELITMGQSGIGDSSGSILPVCLPISGGGTFSDMYAVKMTDDRPSCTLTHRQALTEGPLLPESKVLQKEVYKMSYVSDKDCDAFYAKNKLTYSKMSPVTPLCAVTEHPMPPCVWDGGAALITRQSWGFWKLIGFSVRGPGCGAPARFLVVHDYMSWINDMLTDQPEQEEEPDDMIRLGVRRLSPVALIMYSANKKVPNEYGQCNRKTRGAIMYKESFEVLMTKSFAQGFFYVLVTDLAQFNCAIVNIEEVNSKTNTAIWVEHYCHREMTGLAIGQWKPRNIRVRSCFLYFKTTAFVKFRFYFSFKAMIEVSLYGYHEIPRVIPNPFMTDETTDPWYPTATIIHWDTWAPYYLWYWYL